MNINVNGTWKTATNYINVNGTWKTATVWVNVNGVWKQESGTTQSPTNLVTNGDFSGGATGWTLSGTGATVDYSTGKAVLTANGAVASLVQFVNVSPNTAYTFKNTFTGATNVNNVFVEEFTASTYVSGHYGLSNMTSSFTVSATTTRLRIVLTSNASTTGTYTFDDIILTQP